MEHRRKVVRLGALVIVLAATVRLLSVGFFDPAASILQQKATISALLYLTTGRVVRFAQQPQKPLPEQMPTQPPVPTQPVQPQPTEPPTLPTEPTQPPLTPLQFSQEDMQYVQMRYYCGYRPDLTALLTKPLDWDLQDGQPAVLIVHTHATECYTGKDIAYSGSYRTLDETQNMVCVGQELARILEEGGIRVIHDRTLHDYPSYNSSYNNARNTIKRHLAENPSIRMVLDLHRDAADTTQGQLITSATVGGQKSAQLMMVVGTDASGNYHPNWGENLALALKLTVLLEQTNPGISRPVLLRKERFNLDLSPGSLLIEVGAAGNTRQEALIAINALGQSILQLAKGSQ